MEVNSKLLVDIYSHSILPCTLGTHPVRVLKFKLNSFQFSGTKFLIDSCSGILFNIDLISVEAKFESMS